VPLSAFIDITPTAQHDCLGLLATWVAASTFLDEFIVFVFIVVIIFFIRSIISQLRFPSARLFLLLLLLQLIQLLGRQHLVLHYLPPPAPGPVPPSHGRAANVVAIPVIGIIVSPMPLHGPPGVALPDRMTAPYQLGGLRRG
jgi:hypothetical protein